MTLDRATADNLLAVLAAASREMHQGCPSRPRVKACYAVIAEMYSAAGYDVRGIKRSKRQKKK